MMRDEAERERLGRVVREGWVAYWYGIKPSYFDSWEIMASQDKEAYRQSGEAVAAAILPPGMIAVEAARVERLIVVANAAAAFELSLDDSDLDRLRDAAIGLMREDYASDTAHPAPPEREGEGG